jgi:uncharacterized protein YozE (UPF0346 family)
MTFKQYILNLHETDDPRGDFVGDVKHDKNFPDFKAYDLNRSYLESKGACDAAMDAFAPLYDEVTPLYDEVTRRD